MLQISSDAMTRPGNRGFPHGPLRGPFIANYHDVIVSRPYRRVSQLAAAAAGPLGEICYRPVRSGPGCAAGTSGKKTTTKLQPCTDRSGQAYGPAVDGWIRRKVIRHCFQPNPRETEKNRPLWPGLRDGRQTRQRYRARFRRAARSAVRCSERIRKSLMYIATGQGLLGAENRRGRILRNSPASVFS